MHFVIYDTEYTSWKGCNENGWQPPQHMEVIQIAAIKIDENFNELGRFDIFVKPTLNPILSDYITNLTGITQKQVDEEGLEYFTALNAFKEFIGNAKCYSYGSDDKVMMKNANLLQKDKWPFEYEMYNIIPLYQKAGIDTSKYNSGALYKSVGLDLSGHEHNALFDVISLIETAKHLSNRGVLKLL